MSRLGKSEFSRENFRKAEKGKVGLPKKRKKEQKSENMKKISRKAIERTSAMSKVQDDGVFLWVRDNSGAGRRPHQDQEECPLPLETKSHQSRFIRNLKTIGLRVHSK